MARVDFFVEGDRRVLVNEINTIPGFTSDQRVPAALGSLGHPLPRADLPPHRPRPRAPLRAACGSSMRGHRRRHRRPHEPPALAVGAAPLREASVDVHWIGSRAGIEARRVPEAGITFHSIPVGKLRRYWDWQNVPDLACAGPAGLAPVLVGCSVACGRRCSSPPAASSRCRPPWPPARCGIPVVVHEQTSVPGLANRIAGRFARRIALTFPLTGNELAAGAHRPHRQPAPPGAAAAARGRRRAGASASTPRGRSST